MKSHFEDCFHADHIGLKIPASDNEIWKYAMANELVIVTNDEDFVDLLILKAIHQK